MPNSSLTQSLQARSFLDRNKPTQIRAKVLRHALSDLPADAADKLLIELLDLALAGTAAEEAEKARSELTRILEELKFGPPRLATFLRILDQRFPGEKPRALVVSHDGQERFPMILDDVDPKELVPGCTVCLDPNGAAILGLATLPTGVGQSTVFLRGLDDGRVELSLQEQRFVAYAAQPLLDAIVANQVRRGDWVVWNQRQQVAFAPLPREEDLMHRFVDNSRIPVIDVARDIGRPHWVLSYLMRRYRLLLERPELMARFGLRPWISAFLCGPSGTGKTLTIKAFLSFAHRLLLEFTERNDLGSRVLRIKSSDLLDPYFGGSDRLIDSMFDDLHTLASQQFTIGGQQRRLPVIVIFEEAEGLSRRRGEFDSAVYDRILPLILQRLDDPTDSLSQLPIIWITTSNRPELVDSAMWRRLAGVRANFGRLDRTAFVAVLGKKLKPELPYVAMNGTPQGALRQGIIDRLVAWLFSPHADDGGQVEIVLRDGTRLVKHRRDFLTGAIVEQAVANAIDAAVFQANELDDATVGLDAVGLMTAFEQVVDGLLDNLTMHNAADYVDLPEQAAVAQVRRLRTGRKRLAALAE